MVIDDKDKTGLTTTQTEEDKNKIEMPSIQLPEAYAPSTADMEAMQKEELKNLQTHNQQTYKDLDEIIQKAEGDIALLKKKDEKAEKRSQAFRYIAGLGDTLSGLANLVGTTHDAANQQQTYNSNVIAQKAEAARKQRRLDMTAATKRVDELRSSLRDLKSAGSLAEAKMIAQHAKDLSTERIRQEGIVREEAWKAVQQRWNEAQKALELEKWMQEQEAKAAKDKVEADIKEREIAVKETNAKTSQTKADNAAANAKVKQEEKVKKEAEKKAKQTADPKYRKRKLQENIASVRDELARSLGYKNYDEYLQYQRGNVAGMKYRQIKKTREERRNRNSRVDDILKELEHPDYISDGTVNELIGISPIYRKAVEGDTAQSGSTQSSGTGKKKIDY